jgi:REP element-mobilizing transposase RayT
MVNKLHKGVNNYLKVIGDSVKDYAYTIEGLDVDRPHIHLEINYKNDAITDTVKHLKSLWSHGHAHVTPIHSNRINEYILKEVNYNNYHDRMFL